MKEYTLAKPLKTSAATFAKLSLDFDALSFADLRSCATIRKMYDAGEMMEPRTDFGFCVAVAFVAACKGTPGLLVQDVVNLSMEDVLALHDMAQDECFFRVRPGNPDT